MIAAVGLGEAIVGSVAIICFTVIVVVALARFT
jgi:hypothetical protein